MIYLRKIIIPVTLALCAHVSAHAQAQLVINNNAFIVIDNAAKLVVQNPATNAISVAGTGGNIVTESEFDQVKWVTGTSTGTYTMPFTSGGGVKIPATVNITGAGTGAGFMLFSTYPGPNWNNNTYRPSDVTHTLDLATGSVNNSAYVIDRFWILDASGYTTKPSATLSLTYIDAEHAASGNSITESLLGAQRFNSASGIWGDYLPQGLTNTASNLVSAIPATSANFFRSWTLSDLTSPLPIELSMFETHCQYSHTVINWATASEQNNKAFTLEKSMDGTDFETLTTIAGAGNTNQTTSYHYTDYNTHTGTAYYRLCQTDFNGITTCFPIAPANGCGTNAFDFTPFISQAGTQSVSLNITAPDDADVNINVFDAQGKILYSGKHGLTAGSSTLQLNTGALSEGIYIVRMAGTGYTLSKKLIK